MRVECSLQCSQELTISLYSEPDKSNPQLNILCIYDSFNILPYTFVHSKRPSCFKFSVKIVHVFRFSPMRAACPCLTQFPWFCRSVASANREAPHIVISAILTTFFLIGPVIFLQSVLLQLSQSGFFTRCDRPSFTPNSRHSYTSFVFQSLPF
jgi:hypothetical protein